MSRRSWTRDEDEYLQGALAAARRRGERFGIYPSIAQHLGRSVGSCRNRASKMGTVLYPRAPLRRRPWWRRLFGLG